VPALVEGGVSQGALKAVELGLCGGNLIGSDMQQVQDVVDQKRYAHMEAEQQYVQIMISDIGIAEGQAQAKER